MFASRKIGDLTYREAGNGLAVVFLHGFTQDSRIWGPQAERLDDEFRVIAWDAPGAGESPDPPVSFQIADWANSLAEFLDRIDVADTHMIGLSWGGLLAQEF